MVALLSGKAAPGPPGDQALQQQWQVNAAFLGPQQPPPAPGLAATDTTSNLTLKLAAAAFSGASQGECSSMSDPPRGSGSTSGSCPLEGDEHSCQSSSALPRSRAAAHGQ